MERIIIREQDNTFNAENLSSYDVAYVPGFGKSNTKFRVPTLITSKYQFLTEFGDYDTAGSSSSLSRQKSVPVFENAQYYPVATISSFGFPTYAIPGFSNAVIDTDAFDLSEFDNEQDLTYYYVAVSITNEIVGEDWEPVEGINYFERTQVNDKWVMTPIDLEAELPEGATYIETYGERAIYQSNVSPRSLNWYERRSTVYVPTSDTQIETVQGSSPVEIKSYYQASSGTPPMFEKGDADPGYRYALYLLSLGMPVYYEQMNTPNWDDYKVDLLSDFQLALIKYGSTTDDDGTTVSYISPYEQGWFYQAGLNDYRKCDDPTIKYTEDNLPTSNDEWYAGSDISIESMYTGLSKRFMGSEPGPDYSFDNMGDYSVKYITSGGYPVFEYGILQPNSLYTDGGLADGMIDIAQKRGDTVALIDHTDNPERSIYETDSLSVISRAREELADLNSVTASYGAMFTPWYSCTHSAIVGEYGYEPYSGFMPGSLAYLSALATQVKNNQTPWLAVSGVSRGKIPYFGSLHTNQPMTNNVADSYQTVPSDAVPEYALVSINPITNIRQYGYCIWGNRTLRNNKNGTKATSFLNIRNVVSDIKKTLFEASQQLLFEQNTQVLWLKFKSIVTPLLETMVSNSILSDYTLTKYNVNPDSGEPVPAYMVLANIQIRPINSVEVFDLTVQIENNEVDVTETE